MFLDLGPCVLRDYRPDDAETYARHANDRDVWVNLRDRFPHPYSASDARQWIACATASAVPTNLAIDVGGEAVGGIGIAPQDDIFRHSAELGFWVGKAYWGRGVATAAVRGMTELAFAGFGLSRLFAHVFEWNPASARVLEKAGFELEGRLRRAVVKDGRTGDALVYAKLRE